MNPDFNILLSERITLARRLRGINQGQLAELANIPQSQVSKLEGKKIADPGIALITSICKGLMIPVSIMIEGTMDELISYLEENKDEWKLGIVSNKDGISYGQDQKGNKVIIDRFNTSDMATPNQIIFGGSGSGKSYAAKQQLLEYGMLNEPFVVIDPQNEYDTIAQSIGKGRILLGGNHYYINPLDFTAKLRTDISDEEKRIYGSVMLSHLSFLDDFFSELYLTIHNKQITDKEKIILNQSLRQVYRDYGYDVDAVMTQFNATRENIPLPSDLLKVLVDARKKILTDSNKADTRKYLENLFEVVESICSPNYLGDIMDMHTNVPINPNGYIFSLTKIGIEFIPLMMMLVGEYVTSGVFQQKTVEGKHFSLYKKFHLYIDEAHRMTKSEHTLSCLSDWVRESRKFDCSVSMMAQDSERFLVQDDNSPNIHGMTIIRNCATKILMLQEKNKNTLELLKEVFRLDNSDIEKIVNFSRGDYVAFFGKIKLWGTFKRS